MAVNLSQTYLYKAHQVSTALDKAFDLTLQKHTKLRLSQLLVLMTVAHFKVASQRQIARFLDISAAAVSRQIEIVTSKGWAVANETATDPRKQAIQLTSQGKSVVKQAVKVIDTHTAKIFQNENLQTGLMQHIDFVLNQSKEVIQKQLEF